MHLQPPGPEDHGTRYSFHGRLSPVFPSQVIVDTTEICNLACIHCPHPEFKKSEHYAGRHLEPSLNAKIIDEIGAHGRGITQYVRYTGEGEPLIHPHVYEMLEYATKTSGTTVTLTTNGGLVNEARAERLLATGIGVIDISLDAFTPETYATIRVKGDLVITRANVQHLIKMVKETRSSTKVVVSYIEQPQNKHETKDFEAFWKEAGADFVVVRRLHSGAGAVPALADALAAEARSSARRPCLYPWERIVLNPRGELSFCPQDWVRGSTVCDYRTATVRETWQSEFYRRLRAAHHASDYSCHSFCGRCPDWKATRWPDEGRSYANMIEDFKVKE